MKLPEKHELSWQASCFACVRRRQLDDDDNPDAGLTVVLQFHGINVKLDRVAVEPPYRLLLKFLGSLPLDRKYSSEWRPRNSIRAHNLFALALVICLGTGGSVVLVEMVLLDIVDDRNRDKVTHAHLSSQE